MGKKSWADFELYVITGENNHPGKQLADVMEQALAGGADILQLRNKTGSKAELLEQGKMLRELTAAYGVPFIVNDHPDLAIELSADGVHLGQEDMPIAEARRLLGNDRIIGISTHSLEQALAAERDGADYIGVGPVYPTNTKPGRPAVTTNFVADAARHVAIPFVAIGGITLGNVDEVLNAGASRICAVSAIVGSESPDEACRYFLDKINAAKALQPIALTVNGRQERLPVQTLEGLVLRLGQRHKRCVAEVDGELIPYGKWKHTELRDGMTVELVHFVGGG